MAIRFPIQPRMIDQGKVARCLGVTRNAFVQALPELARAGFPKADPVLGTYCLEAVDNWIAGRAGLKQADNSNDPVADMMSAIRGMECLK